MRVLPYSCFRFEPCATPASCCSITLAAKVSGFQRENPDVLPSRLNQHRQFGIGVFPPLQKSLVRVPRPLSVSREYTAAGQPEVRKRIQQPPVCSRVIDDLLKLGSGFDSLVQLQKRESAQIDRECECSLVGEDGTKQFDGLGRLAPPECNRGLDERQLGAVPEGIAGAPSRQLSRAFLGALYDGCVSAKCQHSKPVFRRRKMGSRPSRRSTISHQGTPFDIRRIESRG